MPAVVRVRSIARESQEGARFLVREPVKVSDKLTGKVAKNQVLLYEHRDFKEQGRRRILNITEHSPANIYSLHTMDFKDCLSSLRWDLEEGIVVTFYEDHQGGGRQYQIWGTGEDKDTHDNGFKDCASSWAWHRGSDS